MDHPQPKHPADIVNDYLADLSHAPDCTSRIHTAAECSCGLADARAAADDLTELLDDFVAAARNLTDNWERGDIAGPANVLFGLIRDVPSRSERAAGRG